jgi:hypothetical protein
MVFNQPIPITTAPHFYPSGFTLFSSYGLSHLHFRIYANLPKFFNFMFLVQVINFLRALSTFTFIHLQFILIM